MQLERLRDNVSPPLEALIFSLIRVILGAAFGSAYSGLVVEQR